MLKKLLIANRGEIAIRIAQGAAELGLGTVGIHSGDDASSLHTRRVDESVALEYTGVIGISGRHRGAVYFTAASEPLIGLLQTFGETDHGTATQADLVGEIANTIAGNARKFFGSEFLISVPIVLRGQLDEITLPRHMKTVVIPIQWRRWRCYLLVSIHKNPGLLEEVLHRRRA